MGSEKKKWKHEDHCAWRACFGVGGGNKERACLYAAQNDWNRSWQRDSCTAFLSRSDWRWLGRTAS
mgnify:FL=1